MLEVERVQLGVRLEKRMVKVLKAVAEYFDVTLTELLESIVLHSFEGGLYTGLGGDGYKMIRCQMCFVFQATGQVSGLTRNSL